MCGLFGMAGNGVLNKHVEALQELALISQIRGLDGAGVYQGDWVVNSDDTSSINNEKLLKTWQTMSNFIDDNRREGGDPSFLKGITNNFFIGHVRAATVGQVNNKNSHPFRTKHYVGAHNGTLVDKEFDHDTKTDSELFITKMGKEGIKSTLEELDWWSAYAISLMDPVDGHLVFARNDQRGLYYTFDEVNSVLFWASEADFLHFALRRANIKYTKVMKFDVEKIYTIWIDEIKYEGYDGFQTEKIYPLDSYYGAGGGHHYGYIPNYRTSKSTTPAVTQANTTMAVTKDKVDKVNESSPQCRFYTKTKTGRILSPLANHIEKNKGLKILKTKKEKA